MYNARAVTVTLLILDTLVVHVTYLLTYSITYLQHNHPLTSTKLLAAHVCENLSVTMELLHDSAWNGRYRFPVSSLLSFICTK